VDVPTTVQLARALRAARDELRDLKSHPLADTLIDALHGPSVPGERLWALARDLVDEFSYSEPTWAVTRLEQLLDRRASAVASAG
jgi:hypothetical protein